MGYLQPYGGRGKMIHATLVTPEPHITYYDVSESRAHAGKACG